MLTAKIKLEITTFRPITNTNQTSWWCSIAAPNVTYQAGGKVKTRPDNPHRVLVAGPTPIDLEFKVVGVGSPLVPLRMFFVQTFGNSDPKGTKNFVNPRVQGNKITVTDTRRDHGTAGYAPTWKFFLLVKNAQGKIGVIDPEVQNED